MAIPAAHHTALQLLKDLSATLASICFPAGSDGTAAGEPIGFAVPPVLPMRAKPRPEKHLLRSEERGEAVRGAFAMRNGGRVDNL
jgi:hypothetical protein